MDKNPDSKDSGNRRLLSKMVQFVKSPTTHWSDLSQPPPDAADTQSRQILKEMIERKRRNDFVRSREFDMLRKLRRKEMLKDEHKPAGPSSQHPCPISTSASSRGRAQTLKKIDEIESQIANAWFRRKGHAVTASVRDAGAATPQAAPAKAAAPAPQERAAPPPAAAATPLQPVAVHAFVPTMPMNYAAFEAEQARKAQERNAAQGAIEGVAPLPPHSGMAGELADFQIEIAAAAKLDPATEEAAIRFANGDIAGAEAGLRDLVADDGGREDDIYTWLTLFDLYRATGEPDKFDDLALHFAARFGRSAPQWGVDAAASSRPAPVAAPAAVSTARFHWSSPPALGAPSMVTLNAALARSAPPWRVDWRRLKTIDFAALPALHDTLQRWARQPVQIQFTGAESLLQVLAENSPPDDRQTDPLWWQTRLALLRVQGEMDEFELVALNYCVTYEVSPPAWEDPKNSYRSMNEKGDADTPAESQRQAALAWPSTKSGATDFGITDFPGTWPIAPDDSVVRPELAGELLESADNALGQVPLTSATRLVEFNCRNLLRVDFGAAGDLLNWAIAQKSAGLQVRFKQVNRLVAAFFGVIGITDAAGVVLRTD